MITTAALFGGIALIAVAAAGPGGAGVSIGSAIPAISHRSSIEICVYLCPMATP
jgi:hypothetical protein